ncbi:MAG: GAF domain-containing sensor histidine kinase [Chloroflexi bacterium]|nr:GAF domain-containing sensor histidine kinase [Chloroflexota bacterium]
MGLHGGLFLPIASGREFIGVLELCSRVIRPPDDELLAMLSAIGSQIGQFVERKRAEDALRFLAEASTVLATALEYETTLRSVAHLAVPTFADLCLVDVVAEDHSIRRVAAAANVALTDETLKGILPGCPSEASCPEGVAKVLRTGEPALYPELSEGQLATTEGACHLRTLYRLGVRSIVIVPLVAGGRSLGAISFAVGESGRRYGPDDLPLVEAIARRAALAVDNARLYREAQAAIQFQNELLSTVSHDLRNPLATIKGWAQLLRRQAVQAGVPGMDRLIAGLANIDATATRMVALINELLDLARHQVGEPLDLDCHPVDLVALARQVADEQRPGADRHEIRVEASVPELTGTWDPVRLERVLANLLANAIKYSPQGGEVTVTVARQQDAVGDWAVVEVRDQGLGIPAADLPHIFERYRRGANVVGRISGVGIGLTSVRHIVEQHGGTMAVSSEEGVGSTFTVRLPLSPEHASTD